VVFTSCKKIIDVKTDTASSVLVIEGSITDDLVNQQIKLTKSVALSSENVFPTVSGATVKVSDDFGNNYLFTETKPGYYINKMKGISGRKYTLTVNAEGKNYTASSTMPNKVKLDSLSIVNNSVFGSNRKTVAVHFKDPANEKNYYRFFMYINKRQVKNIYVNNDRLTNGNAIRIQLYYNSTDNIEELKKGDVVDVEMLDIDSNVFDYWYSLSQQSDRGPNQGTTPSNPPSNLSNGALGYFSAQVYQTATITVK